MEMLVFECLKAVFRKFTYVCMSVAQTDYTTDPIWRKFTPHIYFKSTYIKGNDELY